MARDGCNCYFSLWTIFCPFTPIKTQKIKIKKNFKKRNEITSFYTCVPKIMIIDDVQFLKYGAQQMDGQTDKWTEKVT